MTEIIKDVQSTMKDLIERIKVLDQKDKEIEEYIRKNQYLLEDTIFI